MSGTQMQYFEYYSLSCHQVQAEDGNQRRQQLVDGRTVIWVDSARSNAQRFSSRCMLTSARLFVVSTFERVQL